MDPEKDFFNEEEKRNFNKIYDPFSRTLKSSPEPISTNYWQQVLMQVEGLKDQMNKEKEKIKKIRRVEWQRED